jgi:hypothetical protein
MKIIATLILAFVLSFHASGQEQNNESSLEKRLEQVEKENIVLKAKIEAFNENNSRILNTVTFTITVLLALFGIVNISQLIQNYRLNNRKLIEVKSSLLIDLSKEVDQKVKSSSSSLLSGINSIKDDILELKILSYEIRCPSLRSQDANMEMLNLASMLEHSKTYFERTGLDYQISNALDGMSKHLEKHSVADYEKERAFEALKSINPKFDYKKDQIDKLLKSK